MRKFFFNLIIVCSLNTFGQITFSQILSLQGKVGKTYNEMQGFLFNNHSLINQTTRYIYQQAKECEPPAYREDNCEWKCQSVAGLPVRLKYRTTQPAFENASIKNYIEKIFDETKFGEDYNSSQKTAKTFITITKMDEWVNTNCNNELVYSMGRLPKLKIQFNDTFHWEKFKKSVIQKAQFQGISNFLNSPRMCYGIRREIESSNWRTLYVELYEADEVHYAEIIFNSSEVE